MSLHPLHFFFIFLYYTDVGSTFFVLAAYQVSPCQRALPNPADHLLVGSCLLSLCWRPTWSAVASVCSATLQTII